MTTTRGVLKTLICSVLVVAVAAIAGSRLFGQGTDDDFRFRPDHERQALRQNSSYTQWLKQEGLPEYKGFSVNLYELKLGPWKRFGPGVTGAYINLDGQGALVNLIEMEIAPGASTKPERHLFEEQIIVLRGEGETQIWQKDATKKVTVPWRRGTVFSPPLNTWHQHFSKGKEPALMAAVTDLPLKLDIFRNPDFIFNDTYNFSDRYNGQAGYFDPENSKDFSPKLAHSLSIVNLIRDAWTWRLFHAGQGYGDIDRHFLISDNMMSGHIETWPVGAYERAHRHGPSLTIVHLGGSGYSLLWPPTMGLTPWKDGKGSKVTRVDWKEGTVVIPPIQWYHQHFATGSSNAKFIMLGSGPGNDKYAVTTNILSGGDTDMIYFKDEDPYVRQLFEKELAMHNAKIIMPPTKDLIAVEKESKDGRIPPVKTTAK